MTRSKAMVLRHFADYFGSDANVTVLAKVEADVLEFDKLSPEQVGELLKQAYINREQDEPKEDTNR